MPKLLASEGYSVSRIALSEKEPIPKGTDTVVIIVYHLILPRGGRPILNRKNEVGVRTRGAKRSPL